MEKVFRESALHYHRFPSPGKIGTHATKPLANQRDLALAYSPGVASACEEIVADSETVFEYTSRGNLVGVISNGSAVLGLGNIGALASKPVMEGKAVLFKQFADIDVFDIEINEDDPEYIIPKPFDPRLITTIPPAVAQAAMDSGVAKRPIEDMGVPTGKSSSAM